MTKGLARLEEALRAALEAEPPDYAAAVHLIEQMVAHPDAATVLDVPELLEELADCHAQAGRFDYAIEAMRRALAAGWRGTPDGRTRIAEFLLRAGRAEETHALYGTIKAETPDDVWLYNAAGLEYAAAGDHERALEWLTEGLDLALRTGDPEGLVAQLSDLRRESLTALGRPLDELEERADQFLADAAARAAAWRPTARAGANFKAGTPRPTAGKVTREAVTAVGWFPRGEFAAAVASWPHLREDGDSYEEYCRHLQRSLLTMASADQAAAGCRPRRSFHSLVRRGGNRRRQLESPRAVRRRAGTAGKDDRLAARPQRPVLVWERPEVQEVLRSRRARPE